MGSLPWRCRRCDARFRVWRIPPENRLLAHCPRCGNINVERVAGKRVEGGVVTDLKRWMNFPAYRCDPCRHKFFSLRPFRPDATESQGATETASTTSAEQPQAQAAQKQERTPAEKTP